MPTVNNFRIEECTKFIYDRTVARSRQELSNKPVVGAETTEVPAWLIMFERLHLQNSRLMRTLACSQDFLTEQRVEPERQENHIKPIVQRVLQQ